MENALKSNHRFHPVKNAAMAAALRKSWAARPSSIVREKYRSHCDKHPELGQIIAPAFSGNHQLNTASERPSQPPLLSPSGQSQETSKVGYQSS